MFYTSHRLAVTSCHHRNLTSAGLPAGRAFARKYHYHRYLLSLSASSNLAAVPKSNTPGKSRGHRSAFLWLVGFPTITATYLLRCLQLSMKVGDFYPLTYKAREMRFGQKNSEKTFNYFFCLIEMI